MTNTETCMREMRHIVAIFLKSKDFDEQWILLKAYLNTVHSLADNDKLARMDFHRNELMNFVLVLRNILHHQPAKWHFGKHDVQPTAVSLSFSQDNGMKFSTELKLVIQKDTLNEKELQKVLGNNSPKQLIVLRSSLEKINNHVIVVNDLINNIQMYVEEYCKENLKYTDCYDKEFNGMSIIKKY